MQGGELIEFKVEGHKVLDSRFSDDGEWIFFNSKKDGKYQLWKIRSDGSGEAIQITRDGVIYSKPALDGKLIYYVKSSSDGIWQISTDDGTEEKIKAISDAGFKNAMTNEPDGTPDHWKVTDKGIYFLIRKPDKSYEMKFYDFATETVTEAVGSDKIPKNILGLFATDGTNFLFNVEEKVSNIMLADLQL